MTWTILILVLLVGPMLFRAWMGWSQGAVAEVRQALVQIFAVLVAARYWQPCAELFVNLVSFNPRYIAVGAFIGLYAAAAVVAGIAVQIKGEIFQSVHRDYVNHAIGVIVGLFSGSLIGGVLVLLLLLIVPSSAMSDEVKLPRDLLRWPLSVVELVETNLARIDRDSSARTLFPEIVAIDSPAGKENGSEEETKLVWK